MPPRQLPPSYLILFGLLISFGVGFTLIAKQSATSSAIAVQDETLPEPIITDTETVSGEYGYERHVVENATAHVITQPPETTLSIAVATDLASVEDFAERTEASYIINGGFFDPNNGKTTSHLIAQGQVVGDPTDNERLIENPALSQYIEQILNRSEFRVYRCAETDAPVYDITFHDVPIPNGCVLDSAIGAGPQLLPTDTAQAEAFIDYDSGAVIRDAIGSLQPNARSAIGLYPDGAIALIMVEKGANSNGMTLSELANFATSLGITKLLNLDGGSSSSLFVAKDSAAKSQAYFGLSDSEGNPIQRAVKSVIVLKD